MRATNLFFAIVVIVGSLLIAHSEGVPSFNFGFQIPPPPIPANDETEFITFGGTVDPMGNSVFQGVYTAVVPGYPIVSNETGFISKYSPDGQLIWAINPPFVPQNQLFTDLNSNIYTSGFVELPILGPEVIAYVIAKYSPAGDLVWSRQTSAIMGLEEPDIYIAADGAGNSYAFAPYVAHVDFGPGTTSLTGFALQDVFLVKFSTDGTFQWAVTSVGNPEAFIVAEFINANLFGDTFLSGDYTGCSNCSIGNFIFESNIGTDFSFGYVIRYTTLGESVWGQSIIGEEVEPAASDVDSAGDLVLVGTWSGSLGLSVGGVSIPSPPEEFDQAFVIQFSGNGNVNYIRTTSSNGDTSAQSVACDPLNNCWFTGTYEGNATFVYRGVTLPPGGPDAINQYYAVKVDINGEPIDSIGGNGTQALGTTVALDRTRGGHIVSTGIFTDTYSVGPFTFVDGEEFKTFVLKFDNPIVLPGCSQCGSRDLCCPLSSGVFRCYNPLTHACTVQGRLCPLYFKSCGLACYNDLQFTCFNNQQLCPIGHLLCGNRACYLPSQFSCVNGQLVPV